MAEGRLRALVATSSLDLGLDWGDVDCVIQMGAPKGSSRLLQRIGRANHRLDEPSRALIVPGNRFEYLEARAALDAVEAGERDADRFRPGALDVLAQHVMALACAASFREDELLAEEVGDGTVGERHGRVRRRVARRLTPLAVEMSGRAGGDDEAVPTGGELHGERRGVVRC